VNSFVLRLSGEGIQTRSTPQEEQRLQVPRAFLERTVRDLNKHVQGCISELVFNLDEVGIPDWEDRNARRVVVVATMDGRPIRHAVSRNVKHMSVIAWASAAGESLMPYIITSQNSPAVQEQLRQHRVRFGRDLILTSNHRPYVNAEIFLEYVRTVFLPSLVCVLGLGAFAAEEAVSLMDNCSAHVTDGMIHLLTEARVRVITFAPHTTHVFQVLDLTLFGVLKRRPRYALPFQTDNSMVKFIMKVYHDFKQTMVPSNVWGAFHALGFDYDTRREPSRLLFDEEKLRGRAGFEELWSLDFPLDQLSDRRRAAWFGWINGPE
jgi:hypothetical protein